MSFGYRIFGFGGGFLIWATATTLTYRMGAPPLIAFSIGNVAVSCWFLSLSMFNLSQIGTIRHGGSFGFGEAIAWKPYRRPPPTPTGKIEITASGWTGN